MSKNYTATSSVLLNGKQAEDMLEKLKKRSLELGKEWNKFKKAGDTAGMKKVEKEIKSVDKATEKLRKETLSVEKVLKNLSGSSMNELRGALRKLDAQINKTTDRGSKEFKQMQKDARLLRQEIAKGKIAMGQWRGPMDKVKTGFKNMVGALGAASGIYAVVSVIRNAARVTTEFSKAQSNLAAVLGATKKEIRDLSQEAVKYGSLTAFTATQVSELQTEFAKFGFTKEQIKASTKAALDFAAATNSELGPAAKVTSIALKAYNLSASNAERVAAAMAVSTTKSALSFEDFETILSTVGPVAKAFGFTLEDTLALTGKLKDAGFDASSAATATRNILLNLADSNGKLAQALGRPVESLDDLVPALDDLKARGIDLNETLQLTDKRSVSAFNAFLTASGSTLQLRDSISGVNEELQEMVDTQLDNLAGDVTKLGSAWQGFVLSIETGDGVIAKFVRGTLQFLTDSLTKLSNIDLIFKRASKFSTEEVGRAYDAMMNLNGQKYQEFQKLVAKENKLSIEQVKLRKEAMIEEIEATGQSHTEAERLWQEFYNRRLRQDTDNNSLLIEEQVKLLAEVKKIPAQTTEEIKAKNQKIIKINEEIDKIIELTEAEILLQKAQKQKVQEENTQVSIWQKTINFLKAGGDQYLATSYNIADAAENGINAAGDLQKGIDTLEASLEKLKKQRESADLNSTGKATKAVKSLITEQEELLKQAKEMPETTEAEIEAKNKKIAVIEKEINRLKSLGKQLDIAALLAATAEQQKEAIKKYFDEAGEGAYDAFIDAIEKAQQAKKIDFGVGPELPEEQEQTDPDTNYAIQKHQQTLEYKMALNKSMYEQGLIGEMQYQDQLTNLTKQAEDERIQVREKKIDEWGQLAQAGTSLVTALMDLELEKAGDNEEKKKEIRKKYADLNFAMTAARIIANTAEGVSKAFAQDGPLGIITGTIVAAAGLVQLAVANAQRKKVKAMAKGKYPVEADDGKTYNAQFAGRPKTGFYDGPQLGIFNEVPGQEEMVIDGITTRKIELNYPEIRDAIFAVRDGRVPQYAEGKYPDKNSSFTSDGKAVVPVENPNENKMLAELVDKVNKNLVENTRATRDLMQWKPYIAIEMIEKRLEQWRKIESQRGLILFIINTGLLGLI